MLKVVCIPKGSAICLTQYLRMTDRPSSYNIVVACLHSSAVLPCWLVVKSGPSENRRRLQEMASDRRRLQKMMGILKFTENYVLKKLNVDCGTLQLC